MAVSEMFGVSTDYLLKETEEPYGRTEGKIRARDEALIQENDRGGCFKVRGQYKGQKSQDRFMRFSVFEQ